MHSLSIIDVLHAQKTIARYLQPTPVVPLHSLNRGTNQVFGKIETTQPIGAFKIRGAINAVANLSSEDLQKGVVCVSTGNHGRALAYAAKLLGSRSIICMSELVPDNKRQAIRNLGAEIRIHGKSQDEAQNIVDTLVADDGMIEIPPFDHKHIITGQATIGLELLHSIPDLSSIIIPISGGGLAAGIALVAKTLNPNIKIIGVSPKRGAAMAASLQAGHPVNVTEEKTLADSLGGGIGLENRYTFKLMQKYLDEMLLLDETQIRQGMRHLFFHENIIVEGAAAVCAAVLLDKKISATIAPLLGEKTAVIVSGKNIAMPDFLSLMQLEE